MSIKKSKNHFFLFLYHNFGIHTARKKLTYSCFFSFSSQGLRLKFRKNFRNFFSKKDLLWRLYQQHLKVFNYFLKVSTPSGKTWTSPKHQFLFKNTNSKNRLPLQFWDFDVLSFILPSATRFCSKCMFETCI